MSARSICQQYTGQLGDSAHIPGQFPLVFSVGIRYKLGQHPNMNIQHGGLVAQCGLCDAVA